MRGREKPQRLRPTPSRSRLRKAVALDRFSAVCCFLNPKNVQAPGGVAPFNGCLVRSRANGLSGAGQVDARRGARCAGALLRNTNTLDKVLESPVIRESFEEWLTLDGRQHGVPFFEGGFQPPERGVHIAKVEIRP